jgi:hypothetical protein
MRGNRHAPSARHTHAEYRQGSVFAGQIQIQLADRRWRM